MPQRRILAIANRGEIAVRIARTARQNGWEPVALLAEPDWDSYAAREIGNVVRLQTGDELNPQAVVSAAARAGATALHPGYGFLSERPALSQACRDAGLIFVGPSPETLTICGDKIETRALAEELGIPLVRGSSALDLSEPATWLQAADMIGYPLIAKIAGAGGGRGLRVAPASDELESAIRSALNEAGASGADADIFLEQYLEGARHVEVQIAGDGKRALALGDRDCSLQRRHQKVVEEAPTPGIPDEARDALHSAAVKITEALGLSGVATVEFLMSADGRVFFMEINPRLQVEHTVTEEVTGLDLVSIQLEIATGGQLPQPVSPEGHAIQARLYAEDPFNQNMPGPGTISLLAFPSLAGLRIDSGYQTGDSVPGNYDPMVAKIIARGTDRETAINALRDALERMQVAGIPTNRPWLYQALEPHGQFAANSHDLATAAEIGIQLEPPPSATLTILASSTRAERSGMSAWQSAGAFRSVAPATMVFHGMENDGWQASLTVGKDMHNSQGDDGVTIVKSAVDPNAYEVATVNGRWMIMHGPLAREASGGAVSNGILTAPMPGTVLAIQAQPGQEVKEGETLAVLEAMKIEISLAAPFDGSVSEVHVRTGDLVRSQQAIITIVPAADEDEG